MKKVNPLLFLLVLVFGSCTKEPKAGFETDKSEYTTGDVVTLTNTSTNATKYEWTFADGSSSDQKDISVTLPSNLAGGNYVIKLKATTKNGKKSSETSKAIAVKPGQGNFAIWTANKLATKVTISINGSAKMPGTLSLFSSFPGCGTPGCMSYMTSTGLYSILVESGSNSWSGFVSVSRGQCTNFELK